MKKNNNKQTAGKSATIPVEFPKETLKKYSSLVTCGFFNGL